MIERGGKFGASGQRFVAGHSSADIDSSRWQYGFVSIPWSLGPVTIIVSIPLAVPSLEHLQQRAEPFMRRLTWGGIALHGRARSRLPCVARLHPDAMEFARLLFGATAVGAEVAVLSDDVVAPPQPGASRRR